MASVDKVLGTFQALSFSFKKAEAGARDAFTMGPVAQEDLLVALHARGARNAMVLSTCNRTEVYWSDMEPDHAHDVIQEHMGVDDDAWAQAQLAVHGMEAVAHLFRVGCALESQIPGDTEIAGQLKLALRQAKDLGGDVAWLDRVVSLVLKASKRVKSETGLSSGATSVAFSAVQCMRHHLSSLEGVEVVLFGLGKLGRNTCKNLAKHASKASITVVNRDEAKARHAAYVYGFTPAPLDGLATAIRKARVLIVATGAQGHTVTPDMIRADQTLLVLDMSMPRNVDPAVADHPNVVLVDVDEMSQHALRQLNARKHHFPHAERIVGEELQEFQAWVDASKVAPLLGAVTQTLRNYRDVELGKLKADGSEDEARLVQLSDKLIQKVTTQVATYLKTKSDKVEEDMEVFGQAFHPSNS